MVSLNASAAAATGGIPGGWATLIAAGIAATVALVSIAVAATNARRDRRRNLYGEAYRTTMSWIEMAYRAYHAPPGDRQLLESYHKLWEDVRYYEGWLIFESSELGFSFARFKDAVQTVCDTFIEEAWLKRTPEPKQLTTLPVEATPETFEVELNAFLRDTHEHLSPNPWKRAAMRRRVRRRMENEGGAHASGLPKTKPSQVGPGSSRTGGLPSQLPAEERPLATQGREGKTMSEPIVELWESMGAEESFLGAPISDIDPTPDGVGKFQHYENNGAIYWTEALGAHEVHGAIYSLWASLGYERSSLGYPTSHEYAKHGSNRNTRISRFERGHIVWEAASGQATAHSEPAPPLPELNVVPIYWGQAWQPGATGSVGNWIDCQAAIERLVNGVYLSWIDQYGIGGGVIGGPHRIESPAEPPEPHKNSQVSGQVVAEIKAGRLPAPNDFAADELPLYIVLLPSGLHFISEEGKALGNPGWHVGFDYEGQAHEAQFAWIGQGDTLDVTTSLFSHELVESFTEEEIADDDLARALPGKFVDRLDGLWVQSYYSHFHGAWVIPTLLNSRQRALRAERHEPVGPGAQEQTRLAGKDKRTTPVSSASQTGPLTH